ncbi:RBBP9/YdeN family alpha/beta hydrolase [Mycetocola saprophilus]|uniref:RBBP9/YdeN family alpha/beta hydrolase n=1 Tax=Mycetocola saprophilus TaxID=76636 RepID=UPI003BF3817E
MLDKKRVVVVHGYGAGPESHWFPWLVAKLPKARVEIPALPDSSAPNFDTWIEAAAAAIADADEDTVLVGHSLGAVTALIALATLPPERKLGGVVLVAGFAEALPGYEALDPFTLVPVDIELLRARSNHRVVFVADSDPIVDPAFTRRLSSRFDAHLIVVPGAGHFQDTEDKTEFPELLPVLEAAGITVDR